MARSTTFAGSSSMVPPLFHALHVQGGLDGLQRVEVFGGKGAQQQAPGDDKIGEPQHASTVLY